MPSLIVRTVVIAHVLMFSTSVFAQESANNELNECIKKREAKVARNAALGGALLGGLKSALDDKKDDKKDIAKNLAVGAAAGAVVGSVAGWAQSAKRCQEKNPQWRLESSLESFAATEELKRQYKYKPEQGTLIVAEQSPANSTVKARLGTPMLFNVPFVVLTPEGAETPVTITRELATLEQNQWKPFEILYPTSENKVVPPGRHLDPFKVFMTDKEDAVGAKFRLTYTVSVEGGAKSSATYFGELTK